MFFTVPNSKYLSPKQLSTSILMNAYFVVSQFPLKASDRLLDDYLQATYKINLKNLCAKLLLDLTFMKDDEGNFVMVFRDPEMDKLARLVTYGTGIIPGSKILQIALKR